MPSASEQWLLNITWIRSTRFRDVLPVDRRMSFLPNVESPQEWSLLRIMRSFLPTCLRPPQEGRIIGPPQVAMPTLSIPRTCNPLFPQPSTAPYMNQHLLDERELPMNSPNFVDNADNVLKRISQLSRFYRIPIRIPKSCRIPVAEALADAIDRTITSASFTDWNNFVSFHILALGVPISPSNAGSSLSSIIRANLKRLTQSPFDLGTLCQQLPCHQARRESSPSENLRSHVNTKLMLNDIKAFLPGDEPLRHLGIIGVTGT